MWQELGSHHNYPKQVKSWPRWQWTTPLRSVRELRSQGKLLLPRLERDRCTRRSQVTRAETHKKEPTWELRSCWMLPEAGRLKLCDSPYCCGFYLQESYRVQRKSPRVWQWEGENSHSEKPPKHRVLNKSCPQEKLVNQSVLLGLVGSLTDLGEGEYSAPAPSSHSVPPTGGWCRIWEASVKVTGQGTDSLIDWDGVPLRPPHHHMAEGLFTAVPLTQNMEYSFQQQQNFKAY
jgi:hypothetical protein